jgi:erythromycin esterase-like protein
MSSAVIVQLLITLGLVLPAFMGGMFARRRSAADVEVNLSQEARNWANTFVEGAKQASQAASLRADRAEEHTRQCEERLALVERRVMLLEAAMRSHGLTPPRDPEG